MQNIEDVLRLLQRRELTLSTAESCTCGLMASLLGDLPGCGQVLDSGFVVYSPKAKNRLLGVSFETIEQFGLTSEEVATEMAVGALNASGAMIAVANTGVADDAQEDEGGTQCYAWALMRGERQVVVSETVRFDGDRVEIRKQAARHGLMQIPERLAQLERKLAGQP
ncbi:MAG TPA: CinA family protein [Pseudomonas sp.]|jgi:PncC family amidohydrolase|uniref:Amidohydrolase, PncC family n=1 Tax=Stutzerimonas balearica DSM 6083 TaxID=1123016 RepID=A0A8D3Y0V7_9GAMM|nr:CinA family protein [Stutzerimonas balearica]MBB60538.1 CinA family protein [Pseudomonas sp.]AJE15276.1 ompetence-damaged protein [Stutzerimonas balearica DSM 6083]MBS4150387.1 CinA family protein [Stutzerimonas balearica]SDM26464.1 amidohydrolase, PncC family [Stutzerimonas balearica DSM 6083]HAF90178.1 CinA family protein [Pseudomonas sp.]